jgi:hypothetical protein
VPSSSVFVSAAEDRPMAARKCPPVELVSSGAVVVFLLFALAGCAAPVALPDPPVSSPTSGGAWPASPGIARDVAVADLAGVGIEPNELECLSQNSNGSCSAWRGEGSTTSTLDELANRAVAAGYELDRRSCGDRGTASDGCVLLGVNQQARTLAVTLFPDGLYWAIVGG